jgi:hypothetical protein
MSIHRNSYKLDIPMKITIFLRIGIDIPLKQIRGIAIPRGIFYVFQKKKIITHIIFIFFQTSKIKIKITNSIRVQYFCFLS